MTMRGVGMMFSLARSSETLTATTLFLWMSRASVSETERALRMGRTTATAGTSSPMKVAYRIEKVSTSGTDFHSKIDLRRSRTAAIRNLETSKPMAQPGTLVKKVWSRRSRMTPVRVIPTILRTPRSNALFSTEMMSSEYMRRHRRKTRATMMMLMISPRKMEIVLKILNSSSSIILASMNSNPIFVTSLEIICRTLVCTAE
mmetsp:Transcript_1297/g.2819  ORF Transcript_1297/g.2819 Transcript_1297/m.2819 type:complete len:202 (-) Transcript_1297:1326-1931(-)